MSRIPLPRAPSARHLALALAALLPLAAAAQGGSGLRQPGGSTGIASGSVHLGLGAVELDLAVAGLGAARLGAQLIGNYYLTGPGFDDGRVSGGLRLTSGLSIGPRELSASLPGAGWRGGTRWALTGASLALGAERETESVTLPYIGLGYTRMATGGGWGLSADIGLGGLRPGQTVRLNGSGPTPSQIDRLLTELRLAPVVQLGVSYAF